MSEPNPRPHPCRCEITSSLPTSLRLLMRSLYDYRCDKNHENPGIQENRYVFFLLLTFTKIVVTFEPLDEFSCLDMQNEALEVFSRFRDSKYQNKIQK